jgi:hypothetical protein
MKFPPSPRIFVALCFVMAMATASYAQASRTWVSGVGDDANPCSRTAPCKTFAGAISKTAVNGEIDCIDPAGFGAVTVTKSITIDGGGTFGSILASLVNGVNVNDSATASPGSIVVIIRNLSIQGFGNGISGVNYTSGKTVTVENCQIMGFTTAGIRANLTLAGNLNIINTSIANIAGDGVSISTSGAAAQVVTMIENSRIQNCNSDGIELNTHVRAGVRNSVITRNTNTGIRIAGADSIVNMDGSFVSFSNVGLQSVGSSAINVSDSEIAQNATGLNANGGTLASFQGNSVFSNTVPGAFTSTTIKQ